MKKYRIVKYNRPSFPVYTIQKRVLFWWFNTDIDGDIVIPFLYLHNPAWNHGTLEMAREALKAIVNNQKKTILDEA